MSGFFSRWSGTSDIFTRPVREVRRTHLRLEELESRDVPAILYVTSLADVAAGPGELRTQIAAAVAGDTVEFSSSLGGGTVDLTGGQLDIPDSITVRNAPGSAPVTIDAEGNSRVFDVTTANTTFYLLGITAENGKTNGTGGGINTVSNTDNLFVTDCTITDCDAGGNGGGIFADNSLTMVGSTVSDNSSGNRGGGMRIIGNGTVETSTITGNTAAINGGGINTLGTLYLSQSNISYNSCGSDGGGVRDATGTGYLTAVNCTFYKNSAGLSGGGLSLHAYGDQHLTNDTIVSNTANGGGGGGGIYITPYDTTLGLTIQGFLINDIVSDNIDTTGQGPNILQAANAYLYAYNCDIDNNTGITGYSGASAGTIAAEPNLGPLQNNGGPTDTKMPMPQSPVINAGTNVGGPNVDQRGVPRPQGGLWDIGAVEVRGYALTIVSGNNQSVPENELFAPLVVQIISPDLGVLSNVNVTWQVNTAANGATGIPQTPLTVATDSNGEASLILLADGRTGTFTVDASAFIPFDFTGRQEVIFTEHIIDSAHTMEFAEQPQAILRRTGPDRDHPSIEFTGQSRPGL